MDKWMALSAGGLAAAAILAPIVRRRVQLSLAKHPSLAGHSRLARQLATLMPGYEFDEGGFYASDGAPAEVASRRQAGFESLAATLRDTHPESVAFTAGAKARISDLQFTSAYRVPFPYGAHLRKHISLGSFLESSSGVRVRDLDGQEFYDLTGSYGVNVFGHDFYRRCMDEAVERARKLGPVLGSYHACVGWNAERLCQLSGLDEVSFHMSGTEAVMQAVRLARFHTRRPYVVRFCGAYHGWWDDVQPGPGNPMPPGKVYTLRDMDERSLRVLATRRDIACVLVNPLQSLHPNASAPGDSALADSSRRAHFDRGAYMAWLRRLREVCTARGVVLILDEVFTGFRLARGGAQELFGVQADLVTYGKTLGGGFPVGVVCGRRHLMRRFRPDRPTDICFARGTFNSHPYVMAAMQRFLEHLDSAEAASVYDGLDERWNRRAAALNVRLTDAGLPVQVANLSSIWTVLYTRPSRYNWMLQFYLRAEGLALSWVGSGRLIFSLNYSEQEFDEVAGRFVCAAQAMERDGWWWQRPGVTNRSIRRQILGEIVRRILPKRAWLPGFRPG